MRSIIVSLAFSVLIIFVGVTSAAQAPQAPATIREVFVDFTNQRITIEGDGFNTTGPTQVNLGQRIVSGRHFLSSAQQYVIEIVEGFCRFG